MLFPKREVIVRSAAPSARDEVAAALCEWVHVAKADSVVVVCIGTDRSIGDAVGPLVGMFLTESGVEGLTVYGTVDNPVHAVNLAETVDQIRTNHRNPLVIAVDASLGRAESVGNIAVRKAPVKPGAGVQKDLPEVGDVSIMGCVNVGGFMEFLVLQNTRLSVSMNIAKVIAAGITEWAKRAVTPRRELTA